MVVEWLVGIAGLREVAVHTAEQQHRFDCLFDACLALIPIGVSTSDRQQSLRCAIAAAAGSDLDEGLAAGAIFQSAQSADIPGVRRKKIEESIEQARRGLKKSERNKSLAVQVLAGLGDPLICDESESAAGSRPGVIYFRDEWYLWRSRYWYRIQASDFEPMAIRRLRDLNPDEDPKTGLIKDVLENLRGICHVLSDESLPLWLAGEAPVRSPYLALANGLIDLNSLADGPLSLIPHTRDHFDTVRLGFNFDQVAECPRWDQFLCEIFPNQPEECRGCDRRVRLLQEMFGYCLLRRECTFEAIFILTGDGANGKSTVLEILTGLLGAENVSAVPFEHFDRRFGLAEMVNKLANISSDMGKYRPGAEGRIKQIASGEKLQVDRKFLPLESVNIYAKTIFATNKLPRLSDQTDGMWRRIRLIPFREQFSGERCNPQLKSELREELPGIFNWAIEGARRLIRQRRFTECDVCHAALLAYRRSVDTVREFVHEMCEIDHDELAHVRCRDLYLAYKAWAKEMGHQPKSNTNFGRDLLAIEGVRKSREGTRPRLNMYVGIRLLPAPGPLVT